MTMDNGGDVRVASGRARPRMLDWVALLEEQQQQNEWMERWLDLAGRRSESAQTETIRPNKERTEDAPEMHARSSRRMRT